MTSPLDLPLPVTWFENQAGYTATAETATLRELAGRVLTTTAAAKADLPWIKLARFGEHRTPKRSLRNNANVLDISGVEADYDQSMMSIDEAVTRLRSAGIAALVFTSPSHSDFLPRWRVLAPCSGPTSPVDRERLTGRINAALGGVLALESFTLSQAYYFGGITENEERRAILVDGKPIDHVPLEPVLPVRGTAESIALPRLDPDTPTDERAAAVLATVCSAFTATGTEAGRHQILLSATKTVAPYLLAGLLDEQDVIDALEDAMRDSGREANDGEVESALRGALPLASAWTPPSDGSEFDILPAATAAAVVAARTARTILSPAECDGMASRPYIVKGLLARGDIACLFGPPGAGKSLLGPLLGYRIARGEQFFGMRTRGGPVLYLAAEDASGMEKRVHGLRLEIGDAERFGVSGSISSLLDNTTGDLAWIGEQVREREITLVVIDTVARAFPGLIENDAEEMGKVVGVAAAIAALGPAVLLIHHNSKSGDGTPRGHSILNGALDMALQLEPKDEQGVIRARLTKNRNGTCDVDFAFRIGVQQLGVDEDGDPVTAAMAVELTHAEAPAAPPKRKLSPAQAAALATLERLATTDANLEEGSVDEGLWMAEVASLSTSADAEMRAQSARRCRRDLIAAGRIAARNDRVHIL